MTVGRALTDTVEMLRRETLLVPFLFVVALPLIYLHRLDWFVGSGISRLALWIWFLVSPFILAGAYGVVLEVRDGGPVRIGDFVAHGVDNYPSLLGAFIIYGVGISLYLVLISVLGNLFFLNILVHPVVSIPVFVFIVIVGQFIDVSIVVGGKSATSTVGASLDLVVANLPSVLGYLVLRTSIGIAFATPSLWLAYQQAPSLGTIDQVTMGTAGAALTGLMAVAAVFLLPLHVHYYASVGHVATSNDRSPTGAEAATTGQTEF